MHMPREVETCRFGNKCTDPVEVGVACHTLTPPPLPCSTVSRTRISKLCMYFVVLINIKTGRNYFVGHKKKCPARDPLRTQILRTKKSDVAGRKRRSQGRRVTTCTAGGRSLHSAQRSLQADPEDAQRASGVFVDGTKRGTSDMDSTCWVLEGYQRLRREHTRWDYTKAWHDSNVMRIPNCPQNSPALSPLENLGGACGRTLRLSVRLHRVA
jgi:hypothetical protein